MTVYSALTAVAVAAVLAAGCGEDDEANTGAAEQAAKRKAPATITVDEAARAPRSITCVDFEAKAQMAAQATRAGANALAATVTVPRESQQQTAERFIFALDDLCRRSDDGAYRPAVDAVKLIEAGGYQLAG